MNPAWIQLGATVLGGLFNKQKNPMAPMMDLWKQYAPAYMGDQRSAYNWLTGPQSRQNMLSSAIESGAGARRQAQQQAMQVNAQHGGAGHSDLAGILNYMDATGIDRLRQQSLSQQQQMKFGLAGQGINSVGSGLQSGAPIAAQSYGYDRAGSDWVAMLPYLSQALTSMFGDKPAKTQASTAVQSATMPSWTDPSWKPNLWRPKP